MSSPLPDDEGGDRTHGMSLSYLRTVPETLEWGVRLSWMTPEFSLNRLAIDAVAKNGQSGVLRMR